jgi:hypothetical protein
MRDLWLNTSHPKLNSRHPIAFVGDSEANLCAAIQLLESAARRT